MKVIIKLILMIAGAGLSVSAWGAPPVTSSTVTVSAEVEGYMEFSLTAMDLQTGGAAGELTWTDPVMGSGWRSAGGYILVDVFCTYPWRLDIYTDNVSAGTGFQKAGLISPDGGQRLPLGWVVSDSTDVVLNPGEPGELTRSRVTSSGNRIEAPWTYLKDRNDLDDPGTPWDEGWEGAYYHGYTTVLFGGFGFTSLPYDSAPAEGPAAVFLEADFRDAQGGVNYTTEIWFDLVAE